MRASPQRYVSQRKEEYVLTEDLLQRPSRNLETTIRSALIGKLGP